MLLQDGGFQPLRTSLGVAGFALRHGQKVLRITTEGSTELIGPTRREEADI